MDFTSCFFVTFVFRSFFRKSGKAANKNLRVLLGLPRQGQAVNSVVEILPQEFYNRPPLTVARDLLGARLVRILDNQRLSGIITEAEAYIGKEDLGCHAHSGKTKRNAVMYGPPGHAYVYFTYGMHWCLNAVAEVEGFPAAVLIRAIRPEEGAAIIHTRRNGRDTNGPAKLTQALGIDGTLNGVSLCDPAAGLWIEAGASIPDEAVTIGPRVGLYTVPEPWKSKPWRFIVSLDT